MAQNFQSSDNFEFGIFSNGDYSEDLHSSPKSRNYSGAKRSKIACDVVENGTLKVQNQILLSQDLSSLNYKNENTISTLNALKQMKHEKLAFCDFDTNDAIDISAIKELTDKMPSTPADITPSYIKYIRMDSLSVFWCCESQIDLFLRYSDRHVSVDATGNITRSTDTKRKQFYYSIVYRNMLNNEIMPVMQSICSNHDISNLSNIFNLFSRELKISSNKNNPVELITIDFSFALMNAISLAFNGCSLYLYLEQAYRKFVLNEPINLTVIASCSVHIFKFVCDKLKVCSKEAKNSIKTSFAKILLAESYNDFLNLFSNLYICLKHSKVPMNLLLSMSSNCREPCFHFDEDLANTSLDFTDFEIKSSLYMKLQCVRDIEFLVETKLNNKEQNFLTNPNVYPEIATYLLRKLGPFCFLWASFCHPRKSNAIIEAHHKVIKHDLLKCTNMKTGRAIRELRVMNNAQMVKARSSNLYKPKNNQKSVKIEDPMETFKKSKAPSITVFDQIRADVEIRADVSKEISENAKIVKKINLQSLATQIFEKIYELKFESSPYTLISTISLQKRDLLLLENERWVNDKIIMAYLKLLAKEDTLIFDSLIFSKIRSIGFPMGENYIRNFSINVFKKILFPINSNNSHWKLCHVNLESNQINMYNSLTTIYADKDLQLVQNIMDFWVTGDWDAQVIRCSQQKNGFDCGIYVMEFSRKILSHLNCSISPENTGLIRKRILVELCQKEMLRDVYELFDVINKKH